MAKLFKPDSDSFDQLKFQSENTSIFLAGSIQMGKAENWQEKVQLKLKDLDVILFNPKRNNWNSDWIQSEQNDGFREQVTWELKHIEKSNIIFFYFDPNTKSPISLMELGYVAGKKDVIVCCPEGFWRKGNIEIMCTWNNIPLYTDINSALGALKTKINKYNG